mmetsp:Transcript_13104/g.15962  ORF Transcript_13104/g.15962 Transcript_13104/m.15962 type:complete len:273 (+) Transcript_13104:108-926(+)
MNNQTASTTSAPAWANPTHTSTSSTSSTGIGSIAQQTEEIHDVNAYNEDFLTQPFSTLDEPVSETIMRDVRSVAMKLKIVLLPLRKTNPLEYVSITTTEDSITQDEDQKRVLSTLRDWDLWGPLIVCLTLSILLSARAPISQASSVFAAVFCSMWIGSTIVTFNCKLLGGHISFFQSTCVLGYSVFPFVLSAFMIMIVNHIFGGSNSKEHVWINMIWVLIGYVWSLRASTVFIGQYIKKERRLLAVFPVFSSILLLYAIGLVGFVVLNNNIT